MKGKKRSIKTSFHEEATAVTLAAAEASSGIYSLKRTVEQVRDSTPALKCPRPGEMALW